MLQSIRNQVSSWVVKGLFVLLILSFAVWGVGDMLGGTTAPLVAAEVGDRTIARADLEDAIRDETNRLRQALGPAFTPQAIPRPIIGQAALEDLIQSTLQEAAADRLGISVDATVVRQIVENEPILRDASGRFDVNRFREVLAANNLTEAGLVQRLRSQVAREQLLGAVTQGATAPTPLVRDLLRHANERRRIALVEIAAEGVQSLPEPTDDDLQSYLSANGARFARPESRSVTVLEIGPDALMDGVSVTDDEVQDAYSRQQGRFVQPERRTVDLVPVADTAAGEALIAGARTAEGGLAAAAAASGRDVIPLENAIQSDLYTPELGAAAFAAAPGEIVGPVTTPLGVIVLQVKSVMAGAVQPLEAVREELARDVRREKAADGLFEFTNGIEDALAGGASLEDIAARFGLSVTRIDGLTRVGTSAEGSGTVAGLQETVRQAFATPAGTTTRLEQTTAGTYVAVRVDSVTPSAVPALNDVRNEVRTAWAAEARRRAARASADRIAQAVTGGMPLADAAAVEGAVVSTPDPVSRRGQTPVPPTAVREAFALQPGAATAVDTASGAAVVQLVEVLAFDPSALTAEELVVANGIRQQMESDLAAQFIDGLRSLYPVEINQAVVDEVIAN